MKNLGYGFLFRAAWACVAVHLIATGVGCGPPNTSNNPDASPDVSVSSDVTVSADTDACASPTDHGAPDSGVRACGQGSPALTAQDPILGSTCTNENLGRCCALNDACVLSGVTACRDGRVYCAPDRYVERGTTCGVEQRCDGRGACRSLYITAGVDCRRPGQTVSADQLCREDGFEGADRAHGYRWHECAGTLDRCPGGWNGTECRNWCAGGTSCVGEPFCGGRNRITEQEGDGRMTFDAPSAQTCVGWNPGWTVRLRCHY